MKVVLTIIGITFLTIYFVRRMYLLTKTHEHNYEENSEKEADRAFSKSHDYISWLMLMLMLGGGSLLLSLNLN